MADVLYYFIVLNNALHKGSLDKSCAEVMFNFLLCLGSMGAYLVPGAACTPLRSTCTPHPPSSKYRYCQVIPIWIYKQQGWQSAKKSADSDSWFFSGFLVSQIRIPRIRIPIFFQHKYLNFKIEFFLQIQQISSNEKHLHEDFGIFNS